MNLASDVRKAEENLTNAQNKLKEAINIEPILKQEIINMKNKIESIKLKIQTLTETFKQNEQIFNELKQQLIELNKNLNNKQNIIENLLIWIKKNEENLLNQFNDKLNMELNKLNELLNKKLEEFSNIKMNETQLKIENDNYEKRIINYQNEISKFRKSIELLESRLLTAQDLLQTSNTDYNRTQLKHSSVKDDLELTKSRTRTEQDEKQNMLKYLQHKIDEFENEWNEEYSTMCNKVQTLDESLLKSKTQFSELKTRLEGMKNEKNFLQEKQNKLKLSLLALMKVKLRGTTKLSQLRCTVADLTKTNKTLVSEVDILKRQTEQMNQLQTKRELQLSNLMKTRDLVLKKLKEDLKEKLSLNLTLSDQYIKMQEEQSKLLSLFYLAVTNSILDQNQLFNAEQLLVLWARILRQRNYWELKLQAKQETKVNDLLNHNYQINQQINEINTNMKPLLSLEYKT
ncbi:unnamed protein product [Schistosoma rodhaini]|nr:unnamed protein product [Schistosoma rodhaini]CAH8681801.1 unnamed protein product [Schistosoma rodhaini]